MKDTVTRNSVLTKVEQEIEKYRNANNGASPLYLIIATEEADKLVDEIKETRGYDQNIIITEFNGIKIIKHEFLPKGELRLTNELPETGS